MNPSWRPGDPPHSGGVDAAAHIGTRLSVVRAAMDRAARDAGVNPASVGLVAISKYHPVEAVCAAYDAGQRDFGENFAQELVTKAMAVAATGRQPRWHFTGALQRNKVRMLRPWVSVVHSVDRLRLAQDLACISHSLADTPRRPLKIFIQVNLANEVNKAGVTPEELLPLAQAICQMPTLRLQGLMVVPPDPRAAPAGGGASRTRAEAEAGPDPGPNPNLSPSPSPDPDAWFLVLAQLSRVMQNALGPRAGPDLSMGMSHDFARAIRAGATLVRIGTAIFGPRKR